MPGCRRDVRPAVNAPREAGRIKKQVVPRKEVQVRKHRHIHHRGTENTEVSRQRVVRIPDGSNKKTQKLIVSVGV